MSVAHTASGAVPAVRRPSHVDPLRNPRKPAGCMPRTSARRPATGQRAVDALDRGTHPRERWSTRTYWRHGWHGSRSSCGTCASSGTRARPHVANGRRPCTSLRPLPADHEERSDVRRHARDHAKHRLEEPRGGADPSALALGGGRRRQSRHHVRERTDPKWPRDILQVGIHHHEPAGRRGRQAREHRRVLSDVLSQQQAGDPCPPSERCTCSTTRRGWRPATGRRGTPTRRHSIASRTSSRAPAAAFL